SSHNKLTSASSRFCAMKTIATMVSAMASHRSFRNSVTSSPRHCHEISGVRQPVRRSVLEHFEGLEPRRLGLLATADHLAVLTRELHEPIGVGGVLDHERIQLVFGGGQLLDLPLPPASLFASL